MAQITLTFSDTVFRAAFNAAAEADVSIEDYIAQSVITATSLEEDDDDFDADSIAQTLYEKAAYLAKLHDEVTVEHLHNHLIPEPWTKRTPGQRKSIGRAFKKLANTRVQLPFTIKLKVPAYIAFARKDSQNRAIYRIEEL